MAIVGAAAGPVVGGFLLEHFWWGSIFLINVPLTAIALSLMALTAPKNIAYKGAEWDLWSSILALVAFSTLTLAIKGHPIALVGTALAGWMFVRRQGTLQHPLLTFDIFRSRMFSGGVIAAWCSYFAVAGVELLSTQRFQLAAGYSPLEAGLLVTVVVLTSLPPSILGAMYLHVIGFLPLIAGGFALSSVGLVVAANSLNTLPAFITGLGLVGVGLGAVMSVASTAIIGSAPARRAGMAASVEEVSYEFGALVGVALLGTALGWLRAAREASGMEFVAAFDSSYSTLLLLVAAIGAAAAVVSWWCFRENPRSTPMNH